MVVTPLGAGASALVLCGRPPHIRTSALFAKDVLVQIRDSAASEIFGNENTSARAVRIAEKCSDVMSSGTLNWFKGQRGYGFIQPDLASRDVFVHFPAVGQAGLRGLNEGQRVSYDVERGHEGKKSAGFLTELMSGTA
jgi:cold shock protein